MSVTAEQINAVLASEEHIELVFGNVERNMFPNVDVHATHTFRCGDSLYTVVDTTDSIPLCSGECLAAWAADAPPMSMTMADVMHEHEVYAVPHYVAPIELRSAVAHPFSPSSDVNFNIVCDVCGSLMYVGSPMTVRYLADAFAAYLECALWSSTTCDDGDDCEPLDRDHDIDDIDEEAIVELLDDVLRFFAADWSVIRDLDAAQAGHDFWLTRNHHGAGFWDRGLGAVGDRLTAASHAYGPVDLYVGDDGAIYC